MAVERFYIYRSGATEACALTGAKDDPRLPPAAPPHNWRFWMQIGRLQAEDSPFGFNIQAAADEIAAKGFSLFTGSGKLLGERLVASVAPSPEEGTADA